MAIRTKRKIHLRPIKESTEEYEKIEKHIIELFRQHIYKPLMKQIEKTRTPTESNLLDAIQSGRVSFYRGAFSGRLNASVSKELKKLGAQWHPSTRTFKIPQSSLPLNVRVAIATHDAHFVDQIAGAQRLLEKIVPAEISEPLNVSKYFEMAIGKVDRDLRKTLQGLVVSPQLTPERKKRLADEWQNNMKLWINDFTTKEISTLRKKMQLNAFAGNRYSVAAKLIQDSFGVSVGKAKFLARQETSLLMSKFKEIRYTEAGVTEYVWGCVAGTKQHPVRPMHKALEGKIFSWKRPPITDEKGHYNNPGQDFNCRCFAKPIVKF